MEKNSDRGSELKVIFQQSSPTFRIKSVRKRHTNAKEEGFEATCSISAAVKAKTKTTRPRRNAVVAKKKEPMKRKVAKVSPATSLDEDSNWSSDSDVEAMHRPSSSYHRLPISHCDLSPNRRNRIAMDKAFSSESALLQEAGELDVSFGGEEFDENFHLVTNSPVSSFQPLIDVDSEPQPSRVAHEQMQTRSLPLFANLQQNLQNTLHHLPLSDALKQVSMLKKLFPNLDVSATLRGQTLDELPLHHC